MIATMSTAKVLVVVSAVFFVALVYRRLEIGIIALVVMVASIMHDVIIPKVVAFGGVGLQANEALLLFMLVIVFARLISKKESARTFTPMSVAVLLFFLMVAIAVGEAFRASHVNQDGPLSFKLAYNHARPLLGYSLFFVAAYGIRTKEQLRVLLRALLWICVIVSILMVAQYFLGPSGKSLFLGSNTYDQMVKSTAEDESVARSLPPGLAPLLIFFIFALTHTAFTWNRKSAVLGLAATILGIGLVFSFTRHFWAVTFLALVIVWCVSNSKVKLRLSFIAVTATLAIILFSLTLGALGSGQSGQRFSKALETRFQSMFKRETTAESSLQNRLAENRGAWSAITRSHMMGIGLGRPIFYRQSLPRPGSWTHYFRPVFTLHNSWLELWATYGILGVLIFVGLSVLFLIRCFTLFRRTDNPEWRSLSIAFFAGYIAFLLKSSMGMTILHQQQDMVTVALMWGIIEVLWRLDAEEHKALSSDDSSQELTLTPDKT